MKLTRVSAVRTIGLTALLSALTVLSLTACSGGDEELTSPPEIVYGVDVCDQCGMIISDERHAAAAVVETETGAEHRRFDDIGDLIEYQEDHPDENMVRAWVHDHESLEWLDAEDATYVRSNALTTPMGHGFVAYASADMAQRAAEEVDGQVLTFDELTAESNPHTLNTQGDTDDH